MSNETIDDKYNDPFDDPKQDVFGRKNFANQVVNLLKDNTLHTLAINADWGIGKTHFVKMLVEKINNTTYEKDDDYKAVYVDIFEKEYSGQDVLSAILIAIGTTPTIDRGTFKNFITGMLGIISVCVNINLEKIADKIFELSDTNKPNSLQSIKDEFNKSLGNKKIVVIIDELDRCSPKYALEVLERVKYIFDLKNIKFIFSTNTTELKHVIRKMYGEIDAEKYLRKFFQLQLELPFDNTMHKSSNTRVGYFINDIPKDILITDREKKDIEITFCGFNISPRDMIEITNRYINIKKLIKSGYQGIKLYDDSNDIFLTLTLIILYHINKEKFEAMKNIGDSDEFIEVILGKYMYSLDYNLNQRYFFDNINDLYNFKKIISLIEANSPD